MRNDPVLKAPKSYVEHGQQMKLVVRGGLHFIRGNRAPYFSVTCDIFEMSRNGRMVDVGGGAAHDLILKHHPDLADLIALHLCDMDGSPMHEDANGWYSFAGSFEHAMGERFHAGNSKRHFPLPAERIDPAKSWITSEYREPTLDEALVMFAESVRCSMDEARKLQAECAAVLGPQQEYDMVSPWSKADFARARAVFSRWIKAQRPRWKAEADAIIAKYSLVPYGDLWVASEAATA